MRSKAFASQPVWHQPYIILAAYSIFTSVGGFLTLAWILGTKTGSESAFLLGFSLPRILLGTGIILVALMFLGIAIRATKDHAWAEMVWDRVMRRKSVSDIVFWVAATSFMVGWIGCFLPAYRLPENLSDYFIRLRPVIVWFTVFSVTTALIILLDRESGQTKSILRAGRPAILAGAIILAIFFLTGVLILSTGLGIRMRADYWYPAGAPALGLQIIFAIVIGVFFHWLEQRLENAYVPKLDLLLCFMLWGITALLWAQEPLRHTFLMPGPYAPNDEIYPYSDGATFDTGSQFALIGQGLFNGQFFDRALYPAFLTYLHAFFGQNTELLMTVQAVIYAIFPLIVYLLGKLLHGRALGISAAVLIMLRGLNSIKGVTWMDLASPKMMLTDFPTAIGVVLIVLFVLLWLKSPSKVRYLVWAGASLGLTLMLRTHVLLLLPILLGYVFITLGPRRSLWLASALLVLGMFTATLPWDMRNQTKGYPLFYTYYSRIWEVLRQRYELPVESSVVPSMGTTVADLRTIHARIAPPDFASRGVSNQTAVNRCQTKTCSIVNHFLHNLTTSVLILPTSFTLDDLRHTIKESTPYWQQNWKGEGFGLTDGLLLTLNLAIIALGIGVAWQRSRLTGIFPAIIFIAYILSNALALTSGGRYITPIDWIICLYFLIGTLQLALWCLHLFGFTSNRDSLPPENEMNLSFPITRQHLWSSLPTFAIIFVIGALVPLAEIPFPRRYQSATSQELLTMLDQQGQLEKANFDKETLTRFLSNPDAEILWGRVLYPRYYRMNDGEFDLDYPYVVLGFPRLVFMMIGPSGENALILPGPMPEFFPQGADAITLGCRTDKGIAAIYVDVLAVFVLTEPGAVYLRSPESALQCPLQEIVCENNELCWSK